MNATGRPFRGVSPDERQAQRRRQLVEAGLDAFGSRGFHLTGVRDVCAAARLTERYFYESFKNLDALFLAVYDEAVARIREVVTRALAAPTDTPTDLARAALRAMLTAYRDDPRVARILLVEVMAVGAEMGDAPQNVNASFAEMIAGITRHLFPGMPERGLEPQLVANGLYGSTLYVSMQWAAGGFREPLEQILAHCMLFYDALFAHYQGLLAKPKARTRSRPKGPASSRATRRTRRDP